MSGNHYQQKVNIRSGLGTYGLHMRLDRSRRLQIGRLGEFTFPPGDYVYVGSALGPGGLQARLNRHLRGDGRPHWHIDWLRAVSDIIGCWYQIDGLRLECSWSQVLAAEPGAGIPLPGFGASDCRSISGKCAAHLFLFDSGMLPERLQETLASNQPSPHSQVTYVGFTSDSQLERGYLE